MMESCKTRGTCSREIRSKVRNAVADRFVYGYDALGRRASRSDAFAAETRRYAYDARSEIVRDAGPSTNSYAWDDAGNALEVAYGSALALYELNALNQYAAVSNGAPFAPAYDADGNLLSDDAFAYEWDAENRLVAAEVTDYGLPVVSRTECEYDAEGRRGMKWVAAEGRWYRVKMPQCLALAVNRFALTNDVSRWIRIRFDNQTPNPE